MRCAGGRLELFCRVRAMAVGRRRRERVTKLRLWQRTRWQEEEEDSEVARGDVVGHLAAVAGTDLGDGVAQHTQTDRAVCLSEGELRVMTRWKLEH